MVLHLCGYNPSWRLSPSEEGSLPSILAGARISLYFFRISIFLIDKPRQAAEGLMGSDPVTTTTTAGGTCSRPASAGTKSNRLTIPARVKVIARRMTQSDEVHNRCPNRPAGRPCRGTSFAMNRAHLLFFPKSKISTEKPFALEKRLLHFLFAAAPPHVSLAWGPKRGFELP
jgi:hypothetical protein